MWSIPLLSWQQRFLLTTVLIFFTPFYSKYLVFLWMKAPQGTIYCVTWKVWISMPVGLYQLLSCIYVVATYRRKFIIFAVHHIRPHTLSQKCCSLCFPLFTSRSWLGHYRMGAIMLLNDCVLVILSNYLSHRENNIVVTGSAWQHAYSTPCVSAWVYSLMCYPVINMLISLSQKYKTIWTIDGSLSMTRLRTPTVECNVTVYFNNLSLSISAGKWVEVLCTNDPM